MGNKSVIAACPWDESLTRHEHLLTHLQEDICQTVDRGQLHFTYVYSILACSKCQGISLYSSDFEDCTPSDVDVEDYFELAFEKKPSEVDLTLVWPDLRQVREFQRLRDHLMPWAPDPVRICYEIGINVRAFSQDLYALQLRKALEAICLDLGAAEYIKTKEGKTERNRLNNQIQQLTKQSIFTPLISQAADELRDLSNIGAHYGEKVPLETVEKLESLLNLIIAYVYSPTERQTRSTPVIESDNKVH